MSKRSSGGADAVGVFVVGVGVVVLIALIPVPKKVWHPALCVAPWIVHSLINAVEASRIETEYRERTEQAAGAAAAKRERQQHKRREVQRRIDALGKGMRHWSARRGVHLARPTAGS